MRKTFKRLSRLITDNFSGGHSEIFLTLGYNYIMSDTIQLNHDMNLFLRKLKRKYNDFEYISIFEYTKNKSLHIHILIKSSDNRKLVFDRNFIMKIWGQSEVYLERIKTPKDVDRIGKYLNPFTNSKKFQRLSYYERNFRIYNSSQGIVKPQIVSDIFLGQALELLEKVGLKQTNITAYDIIETLENGKEVLLNTVINFFYRKENYKYEKK